MKLHLIIKLKLKRRKKINSRLTTRAQQMPENSNDETHTHKIIITLTDNCIFIACKQFDVVLEPINNFRLEAFQMYKKRSMHMHRAQREPIIRCDIGRCRHHRCLAQSNHKYICSIHFIASFFFLLFFLVLFFSCTFLIGWGPQADLTECIYIFSHWNACALFFRVHFVTSNGMEKNEIKKEKKREREDEPYLSVIIMYRRRYFIHIQHNTLYISIFVGTLSSSSSSFFFMFFGIQYTWKKCIFLS